MGRMKLSLGFLALAASTGALAAPVRFQPVAQTEATVTPVGGPGSFALSFGIRSLMPISSPFKTVGGNPYRFQTSTGFGLEASFSISDQIEVGVATGYESFETRSNDNTTQFESASVRQFPVEVIGRYRMAGGSKDRWIPEAEVGLGWAFGSLNIDTTTATGGTLPSIASKSLGFFKGHAAVGLGFPWTDELSAHLRIGYGFEAIGSATYVGSRADISQSSISGFFARGDLRWAF